MGEQENKSGTRERAPHVVAAEAGIEALNTTPLAMPQRLKADLARVADIVLPQENQEAVAARVREYVRVGTECIRHYSLDAFDREQTSFWREINVLRHPPIPPLERDRIGQSIMSLWGPTTVNGCPEFDNLWSALKPGEVVRRFDWGKVVLAGPEGERTLTRRELRLRSRPRWSDVSEELWIARYGAIEAPRSVAR